MGYAGMNRLRNFIIVFILSWLSRPTAHCPVYRNHIYWPDVIVIRLFGYVRIIYMEMFIKELDFDIHKASGPKTYDQVIRNNETNWPKYLENQRVHIRT